MKTPFVTACLPFLLMSGLAAITASAQPPSTKLPMDSVYQGRIVLPDFKGRDKEFSTFRTRIREEMKSGPNFAGHYAIVVIGCGMGCRFAFIGDVANGQMFQFPYGGEEHLEMILSFNVKGSNVGVRWVSGDNCMSDTLLWNGAQFQSTGHARRSSKRELCEMHAF